MSRPNVLIVICDDLGWGDLSCHGNEQLRTPCLDQLAGESAELTRYCSGPLCTPARAALMTGRHPYRTRAIDTYLGRSMIDPGEITLAHMLRDQKYRTGIFGKWHLGDCHPVRAIDMGFDEALVHNGGGLRQPANLGRDSFFNPDLMHNGKLTTSQGYCTDVFTNAAVDFISQSSEQPFFCYLGFNAPHSPLEISDHWAKPYRDMGLPEITARFYGMVANIDANVGKLMAHLQQSGLADNTVVIFTSDHGPCGSSFPPDAAPRYNSNLRGFKGSMYEGGIRVPCFMRYPGRFKTNTIDRLVNPIDLLPTLAEACNAKMPEDRTIDGVSLMPLLTGQTTAENWPERTICMQWHRGDVPVFKRNAAAMTQRWKWYSPKVTQDAVLFDLENDPTEQHDCAADHTQVAQRLAAEYEAWFTDVSTTRPNNYEPPRINLGHPAQSTAGLTWQDWRLYPDVPENDAHWGERQPGYWLVHVHTAGVYQIVIDLTQPTQGNIHFQCAGQQWSSPLARSIRSVCFDMTLPKGDAKLEAFVLDEDRRLGAKVVHVSLVHAKEN